MKNVLVSKIAKLHLENTTSFPLVTVYLSSSDVENIIFLNYSSYYETNEKLRIRRIDILFTRKI